WRAVFRVRHVVGQLGVVLVFVFFFFQAEDGIRDWSVTGVQTCALPICHRLGSRQSTRTTWRALSRIRTREWLARRYRPFGRSGRSEERRVGKECRSRWAAYR